VGASAWSTNRRRTPAVPTLGVETASPRNR
jgi:hypothetical protein